MPCSPLRTAGCRSDNVMAHLRKILGLPWSIRLAVQHNASRFTRLAMLEGAGLLACTRLFNLSGLRMWRAVRITSRPKSVARTSLWVSESCSLDNSVAVLKPAAAKYLRRPPAHI